MPLKRGASQSVVSSNIKTLVDACPPQATTGVSPRIERNDAIQRGYKIAENMRTRARQRHAQASIQTRQFGRERQRSAAPRFEKRP